MNKKKVNLQKNKFVSARSSKQKINKNKRTESSRRWLSRQLNDPYVSEAQKRGFRSRSAFKLLQIDEKFHLFKSGMNIIDLVLQSELFVSKSEIRRTIKNKGIKLNNNTVDDEKKIISFSNFEGKDYLKLSHGKKKHVIIKITN